MLPKCCADPAPGFVPDSGWWAGYCQRCRWRCIVCGVFMPLPRGARTLRCAEHAREYKRQNMKLWHRKRKAEMRAYRKRMATAGRTR